MRVILLVVLVSMIGSVFAQKTKTYNQLIADVKLERGMLSSSYLGGDSAKQHKSVFAAKDYIYTQLIENIFPSWYGTEWAYEGYSNVPKKGLIACGYFVATTLKHIGFNLNRYKLAQQYSTGIVKTLCSNIQYVRNNDTEKLFRYINSKPKQLYVVGLDNHVGFISKEKDGVYFIHSSYLDESVVIKENAQTSEALISSNLFVLGEFTQNDALVKSWLLNREVVIRK
ncbi:MAG: hypothetical protein COB15_00155 [Flavobacteriales bacterium]|nr:MAG: hypothetical protein COB15_00155 [Flavobacteriales bacterium]